MNLDERIKRLEDLVLPTHKEPTKDYCGCSVPCKPVKSNRQEKVEELMAYLSESKEHGMRGFAEAALEWVSKQISDPKHLKNADGYYREALSDVRKNLGVE